MPTAAHISRSRRRSTVVLLGTLVMVAAATGCGQVSLLRSQVELSTDPAEAALSPLPQARPGAQITIAFAGDSNAEGTAGTALTAGLGPEGHVLDAADLTLVNLETAIADTPTGLVPQAKQYTFRAPARYLDLLAKAGVDGVSLANNHALDFGRPGLVQTLAARHPTRPVMLGVGSDDVEAWRPWVTQAGGRRVVVYAVTDVLDDELDWNAGVGRGGLASVKSELDFMRLRRALRQARRDGPDDIVVVFLHAGVERMPCPTKRQQELAVTLAQDGVDVVAMSHAHVLQPATVIGRTAVLYGLGNFIFASSRAEAARTGVITVRAGQDGSPVIDLRPATIRSGVPVPVPIGAAKGVVTRWRALGAQCAWGAVSPAPAAAAIASTAS